MAHWDKTCVHTATGAFEHDLVVEAETELGHSREIALHLHSTEDLGADDIALCVDEEVDTLDHVEEYLVLTVADALCPPRDCVGDRGRGTDLYFEFVGLLGDISAQSR